MQLQLQAAPAPPIGESRRPPVVQILAPEAPREALCLQHSEVRRQGRPARSLGTPRRFRALERA
eukprot:2189690-Alexandrium_andersonii.AAC.1